jgi:Zn-dependent protease
MNAGDAAVQIVALVFAVSCHEAAHAWTAWRGGDPTARYLGRVTLNPLKHLDPMGSLIVPLALYLLGSPVMFGWAKPVPVVPGNLRRYPLDHLAVDVAGIAVNAALAVLSAVLLRVVFEAGAAMDLGGLRFALEPLAGLLVASMSVNLVLAVFNSLPIPPLDGGHVAMLLARGRLYRMLAAMEPYGIILLLVLVSTNAIDSLYGLAIKPLVALAVGA